MLRVIIAFVLHEDNVSLKGFFNTGALLGLVYAGLTAYVIATSF